jgi:cytochrome c biogenesis protein CcmG/thiol:disulfide interchange protein DsbE
MKLKFFIPIILLSYGLLFSGQTVPDFKLKDANNNWTKFSEIKGNNLTVIDFWATWCSPCMKAIPKLNKIYDIYKENGVQFIGLNMDSPRNAAKIKPFINAHNIQYPVLKDPDGTVTSRLNITSIPVLLIVNKNGEIVFRHLGYRSGDEKIIEEKIKKLLFEEDV